MGMLGISWFRALRLAVSVQQCSLPPAGRVFALEMAFFVSTETASGLMGGVMFDDWHLGTRGVAAIMCGVAAACAVRN